MMNLKSIIDDAKSISREMEMLGGIKVNNILISPGRVSVSTECGIEKAAALLGGEIEVSPSGMHIGFEIDNIYFGQRTEGSHEN